MGGRFMGSLLEEVREVSWRREKKDFFSGGDGCVHC